MTITQKEIPKNLRLPLVYNEFDPSQAVQGAAALVFKGLMIGQKLAGGAAELNTLYRISSRAEAQHYFGAGSLLERMINKWFENNTFTSLYAIALDETGSTKATGSIEFTDAATEAGSLAFYLGQRYQIAVLPTESTDDLALKLKAKIDADPFAIVTCAIDGGNSSLLNFTLKNAGEYGNSIKISTNYYSDEVNPAGLAYTLTAFNAGAVNPDVTPIVAAIEGEQYNTIAFPYRDNANLLVMKNEMNSRWNAMIAKEGHVFISTSQSFADATTFGSASNDPHLSAISSYGSISPEYEWAAGLAGVVARKAANDPAIPFQTEQIKGVYAPLAKDKWSLAERNQALFDGISVTDVGAGGEVIISTIITTYQTNALGAEDPSYLYTNTMLTLSYLRFDLNNELKLKFPQHKLGRDGTSFAPGQKVATPNAIKAVIFNKFKQWELKGLVEDFASFKKEIIVEIDQDDPNRVGVYITPNLINQLRVIGIVTAFKL